MIRAHKIRLNPTPEQYTYLMKAAGTARYAYNQAVAWWQGAEGKKPTALGLKKKFNAEKPAWAYEVTKCAAEGAFTDLGKALTNFYEGRAGPPQFKSRKRGHFRFKINNDKFDVSGHWIKIPKLGLVNMAEKLRWDGKILGAVITRQGKWWYTSITVEVSDTYGCALSGEWGVDVGLLRLATLSDGTTYDRAQPLRKTLPRLARLQQVLARKEKGSKNYEKTKNKIRVVHKQVRDIRDDLLHKLTTEIARHYGLVAIEDLHVKGMVKNHHLALSLSDAALGRLLNFLERKVQTHLGIVVKVDRFFASSKTCSNPDCGWRADDQTLADRVFTCQQCGLTLDRDINAALNICREGLRIAFETGLRQLDSPSGSGYDVTLIAPSDGVQRGAMAN
jgi:putative transposase